MAYTNLGDFLTACANAIRSVEGSTATIIANDMPDRISALGGGSIIPSDLPSDGKTRFGYKIPNNVGNQGYKITLIIYQSTSSTSTSVDWGDNSTATTTTGSGRKTLTHTYSSGGDYIVTITINAGTIYFGGGNSYTIYGSYNGATTSYQRSYIRWAVLGTGVTKLDTYSFYYCYKLQEIRFPATGFTSVGNYAFQYCYSLHEVELPNTVTTLGTYVFGACRTLQKVTLPTNTTLKTISNYAFQQCYSLASLTIPSQFNAIGNNAFDTCSTLYEITLPSTMTTLNASTFSSCTSLSYLSIPSTVTSIGASALATLTTIQKIRFNSASPPSVSNSNAFTSLPTNCIISVPTGKLSSYTGAANYPSSSTYTYVEEAS